MSNKNINLNDYLDKLVGRVYKILPLLEEDPVNAKKYMSSLINELEGATSNYSDDSYLVSTLFSLQGVRTTTDYNILRKTVFECLDNVNKLKAKLKIESEKGG
jgi:hypothetical protein